MRAIEDAGPRTVASPSHAAAAPAAHASGHAGSTAHGAATSLAHTAATGGPVASGTALRLLDAQTGDRRKTDAQVRTASHAPSEAAKSHISHPARSGIEAFLDGAVDVAGKVAHGAANAAKTIGTAEHNLIENAGKTLGPKAKGATDFVADTASAVGDVGKAVLDGAGDVASAVAKKGVFETAADMRHTMSLEFGRIAKGAAAHPHDPAGFVNWLAGPNSPRDEDFTAAVPGLQTAIGNVIDGAMKNPLVSSAIGTAFGFKYVADGDYYTTTKNSLQSLLGFADIDDTVGKLLGMDIDHKTMKFTADGIDYRVEIWKGGYANGGAFGGEIGVYTRGAHDRGPLGDIFEAINPNYYSSANGKHQVPLSQTIYNKNTGQVYFENPGKGSNDGKHYWNLAIKTSPDVHHDDLAQHGSLTMNDKSTARALYNAMKDQGLHPSLDGTTVTYDWK